MRGEAKCMVYGDATAIRAHQPTWHNTLHYTSYLVYASYKKTVHWRITESNIDDT